MFALMKSLTKALRAPSRRDRELAYLSDAASLYDIECRERQIDLGLFRPQSPSY